MPEALAAAKPMVEEIDQSSLAAMRAADALFGKAAEPVRSVSPAMRAAEDAFNPVQRDDTQLPASPGPGAGRILPSLIEHGPVDMQDATGMREAGGEELESDESDVAERETPRRSRLGRTRHSPVRQLDASQIDAAAYAAHFAPAPRAPALSVAAEREVAAHGHAPQRLRGYARGRIYARWVTHEAIRPGERWKLRLGILVKRARRVRRKRVSPGTSV